MKGRKVNLGFVASILCVLAVLTIIFSLSFFPSPVKQVKTQQELLQTTKPVTGTELRIAYGKEGPTQPHVARVMLGNNQVVADLGKIDKK